MKIRLLLFCTLLFIAITNLLAEKRHTNVKPLIVQSGFTENKGQFRDQNGNPNPDLLYMANMGGIRVRLRKDGFNGRKYSMSELRIKKIIN